MAAKYDAKAMLEQFYKREEEMEEDKENVPVEFMCQYNLLRGFKMEISAMERKKVNKWKEMAILNENKYENKKNERNQNIREQTCRVELQLEKNRLQKMNGRKDVPDEINRTFNVKSENHEETLPYTANSNSDNIGNTGTDENDVKRDSVCINKSHESSENNLNGMDSVPALKKHMECLQALQSRQKELDEWYDIMQKQLDLEKMRLTSKYEEMHLKNIREQQSIIDSSQEFLRCASNNNTPSLLNANYNTNCEQILSEKNQSTPLLGILKESTSISKSSSLLHTTTTSACTQPSPQNVKPVLEPVIGNKIKPVIEPVIERRIVIENEIRPSNDYITSNKNSMEYTTPLTTPDKDTKTFLDNVVTNQSETKHSDNNNKEIGKEVGRSISNSTDSNRRYTCTDSNTGIYNNSTSIPSLVNVNNEIPDMNLEKKSCHFSQTKLSVEIPDELKPVISVPPRTNSKSEVTDLLEIGNNSVEELMKKPFNELKVRRKSRPVKFFNDPFPPAEFLSSHEFDEDVAMTTNTSHVTLHSPIGLPLNKGQHQQKNNINEVVSSPMKTVTSPSFATSHSFMRHQQQFEPYQTLTPEKLTETSDIHKVTSSASSLSGRVSSTAPSLSGRTCNDFVGQVGAAAGSMLLATPTVVNCSTSTTNFQRGCSTSTPQQVQMKGEEGFLLEISAVASQQNNDITPKSIMSRYPVPKGADKLYAVVKGVLTRRLFNTIKVQDIVKTIKDTEEFLIDINKENIFSQKLADRQLKVRLQDELSTKRGKLHDIFFNMDARDQMKMLAISRAQVEEKNRKKQAQMKPSRSNPVRNVVSSSSCKVGSTASQKSMRRKQTNNITEKASKTKPVSEKVNSNVKKGRKEDVTNVTNMYVCIAGALKPIQSCTSPTMADRKKAKSPVKASVQNRYTKKSSASKRLDMNAAVGTTR